MLSGANAIATAIANTSGFDGNTTHLPASFDAIVVGAGAAGLYSALCLPESLRVGVITKDDLPLSASDWAQGGIAAAIARDDSPDYHFQDTLKAGVGLCDADAVAFLVQQAPQRIQSLVDLGIAFDRHGTDLALTLEAAHSRRRVLHASDTTGRAIVAVLSERVRERPNVQILSPTIVLDLWLDAARQQCQGVVLLHGDRLCWVRAGAVILATGGGGQVYARTTNPSVSTGDGVAIAWRAGATLRDLEFVQFHPTALTHPGAPHFLISEAVRGEGAHLVDDRGRRFAFDYHPDGELAPRDVVSRSIFQHFQRTGADPATAQVWLDFRPIERDRIRYRFPKIAEVCRHWGIDIFQDPVPVAPAAHYWMGGVVADLTNRTSIPGLYAVGEVASTGIHGANRLASNSLLECLVFAAELARLEVAPDLLNPHAPTPASETAMFQTPFPTWNPETLLTTSELAYITTLRQALPRLVWQSAGVYRKPEALAKALSQVEGWQREFAALPCSRFLLAALSVPQPVVFPLVNAASHLKPWSEVRNLLDVAYLILRSAAFRTESRGAHYRTDYPRTDPQWQAHTLIRQQDWWTHAIVPPPQGL